MIPYEVHD